MRETFADPIIVAAFALAVAWFIGFICGRMNLVQSETVFRFEMPDGTIMKINANQTRLGERK